MFRGYQKLNVVFFSAVLLAAAPGCVLKRNAASRTTSSLNSTQSDPSYAPALLYTDATVRTLASNDGKLYMGGDFKYVGPYTRSAPTVDLSAGTIQTPAIRFEPRAIELDGSGGYYVAGTTPFYNGSYPQLVHVLSGGGIDTSFSVTVTGSAITGLKKYGSSLFLTGNFSQVNSDIRQNFAAVDVTSGATLACAHDVSVVNEVVPIEVSNGLLYIGNVMSMTWAGGLAGNYNVVAFDVGVCAGPPKYAVQLDNVAYSLKAVGSDVYAGGKFTQGLSTSVGDGVSLPTNGAAVVTADHLARIHPDSSGPSVAIIADPMTSQGLTIQHVASMAVASGRLYVTGSEGASPRTFTAGIDTSSDTVLWSQLGLGTYDYSSTAYHNYNPAYINGMAVSPDGTRLVVAVNNVDLAAGENVEVFDVDPSDGTMTSISFGIYPKLVVKSGALEEASVKALALSSASSLHIGGHFASVVLPRSGVAQVDLNTSLPTAWDPSLGSGAKIYSIAAESGAIYVGGDFFGLNMSTTPLPVRGLAAVDAVVGTRSATFRTQLISGIVYRVHKIKSSVVVLGDFSTVVNDNGPSFSFPNSTNHFAVLKLDGSFDQRLESSGYEGLLNVGCSDIAPVPVGLESTVQSRVVGDDLFFVTMNSYCSPGSQSVSAIQRVHFTDDHGPESAGSIPFFGSGRFTLTLTAENAMLAVGDMVYFGGRLMSAPYPDGSYNSLAGFDTEYLTKFAAGPLLNLPMTSGQVFGATTMGSLRGAFVEAEYPVPAAGPKSKRAYLSGIWMGGLPGSVTSGVNVLNVETGLFENPAANSTTSTNFRLNGDVLDGMGMIKDTVTIGDTTYIAGVFTGRSAGWNTNNVTQMPHIMTIKNGEWIEP